jgi:hypothetical protein
MRDLIGMVKIPAIGRISQKTDCIHMIPVKMGMVGEPQHCKCSIASFDSPIKILDL